MSEAKPAPPGRGTPDENRPFVWLSQSALIRSRSAAGANGLAVLLALASRAPIDGSDFKASAFNLAESSGLSVRMIHRIIPILESAKVIAVQSGRGRGENGGDTSNTYRLLSVNLSYAEGGDRTTGTPPAQRVRTRAQSPSTSLAEDREVSAEGKETYPPTAPDCPEGHPGLGETQEDPDKWL